MTPHNPRRLPLRATTDNGLINGRPATDHELTILARARAAAVQTETDRLFSGTLDNPKFNSDNGG